MLNDSLRPAGTTVPERLTSAQDVDFSYVGSIDDPRFGTSFTSMYAELLLETNNFQPGANATADSLVLFLAYDDVFGDNQVNQDLFVHRLTEPLDDDTVLNDVTYSIDPTPLGSAPIGLITAPLNDDEPEVLRIRLDDALAQEFADALGTSDFENSTNFQALFNGLYVTPDDATAGDVLIRVRPEDPASRMRLFFSSDEPTDSIFDFLFSDVATRVNSYQNDLTAGTVQTYLDNGSSDDSLLYVGPFSTTKARIDLPDLSALQGQLINRAELSFYQVDAGTPTAAAYEPPLSLFLYTVTGPGENDFAFLPDFNISNPTPFGGERTTDVVDGLATNRYTFTVTEYLQSVINGTETDTSLYVTVFNNNIADRVVLGGGNHSTFPLELTLYITQTQ